MIGRTLEPCDFPMQAAMAAFSGVRAGACRVPSRRWWSALLALACVVVMPYSTAADGTPADGALAAGFAQFEQNCAICHGLDARGAGSFADLLKVKPPDLTVLARSHGGTFPFTQVYRRIDGRDVPLAHGTATMPLWGTRLKRAGGDETHVRGRLFEIILYLESIQEP